MTGETSNPQPLGYAVPADPADIGQAQRDEQGFQVDLGPMPTEIFIAALVPHAVWLVGVGLWLFASVRWNAGYDWIIVTVYVLAAVLAILRLTRQRMVNRTVGGTAESIYYRGPETGGKTVLVDRSKVESIGVRRSWWRPWMFELVAVRKKRFWTFSSEAQGVVVLLLDLDYGAMARLAMELRDVPGATGPVLSCE